MMCHLVKGNLNGCLLLFLIQFRRSHRGSKWLQMIYLLSLFPVFMYVSMIYSKAKSFSIHELVLIFRMAFAVWR